MTRLRALLRCTSGASAAEFAMVLPLLLIFLFGIIDGGRFLWETNRAEKATQVGARVAAVTAMVPGTEFADYSFAVAGEIPAGDKVDTDLFDEVICEDGACTCTGSSDICDTAAYDAAAFTTIVDRMADMYPGITADNVTVSYRNVGLGYSGDPNGPDVAPLITVSLKDLSFQPITTLVFGAAINMPSFKASLTAEDLTGTVSN